MENGTAEIGLRGRVQGRGVRVGLRPSNGRIVGRSLPEPLGLHERPPATPTPPAEQTPADRLLGLLERWGWERGLERFGPLPPEGADSLGGAQHLAAG